MSWLKGFTKAASQLFAGNVLEGYQPIDFYHYFPMWYALWVDQVADVLISIGADSKSYAELAEFLPMPSSMRSILVKAVTGYAHAIGANPESYRTVTNFFARMLDEACPDDPFALNSNRYLLESPENVLGTLGMLDEADLPVARSIGRLTTAAGSLVHGLYNDLTTDFGWDVYGPYVVEQGGETYSLLVRHFPNLSPRELWPDDLLPGCGEVKMYTFYQEVEWEILAVGCHTIARKGSPVFGLKKYAVLIDGKRAGHDEINEAVTLLSAKAETLYRKIRSMDLEELKQKVMLQECFQLHKLFTLAGRDWRPDGSMRTAVAGKPLMQNLYPYGEMITSVEEFERLFEIEKFESEVLVGN